MDTLDHLNLDLGQFQPATLEELRELDHTTSQQTLVDVLGVPDLPAEAVQAQRGQQLGLTLMATTATCADADVD